MSGSLCVPDKSRGFILRHQVDTICIGCSQTYGYGLKDRKDAWPHLIGGLNLGVPAYGMVSMLRQLEAFMYLNPKNVVWCQQYDHIDRAVSSNSPDASNAPVPWFDIRRMEVRDDRPWMGGQRRAGNYAQKVYEYLMQAVRSLCNPARLIFVYIPDYRKIGENIKPAPEWMREERFIDLTGTLAKIRLGGQKIEAPDGHLNEISHKAIAEAINPHLA